MRAPAVDRDQHRLFLVRVRHALVDHDVIDRTDRIRHAQLCLTPNLGVARSVTLTVAGRQVTVAQSAAVVPAPSNVHIVGASEQ
jgi:hypothetical protein